MVGNTKVTIMSSILMKRDRGEMRFAEDQDIKHDAGNEVMAMDTEDDVKYKSPKSALRKSLAKVKRLITIGDVKGAVEAVETLIENEPNSLEVKILCHARLFKSLADKVCDDSCIVDLCDRLHNDMSSVVEKQDGVQINKRLRSFWEWMDAMYYACDVPNCGISSNKREYVLIAILIFAVFCGLVIWLVMSLL